MQLCDLPSPQLTERLMSVQEDPADRQASSHWRQMHESAVARVGERAGAIELSGAGFGNVRKIHPAQIPLEWMTSLGNALLSQGAVDLGEAFDVLGRLFGRVHPELRLRKSYDAVRQVFVWQTIRPFLQARRPLTWCVIGDGYGVFSALIREFQPDAKVILVDLAKTLVFQSVYLQMMHSDASHSLLDEHRDGDFLYCPASQAADIDCEVDVFVNVNSMQEMTMDTIRGYFEMFRRNGGLDSLFYCCNRVEKCLPGGEMVRFLDYPWSAKDEILLDGICRYQRFFLHLRTAPKGPRIFGARIPFINEFDGDHWHRLVRLETFKR